MGYRTIHRLTATDCFEEYDGATGMAVALAFRDLDWG